MKKEKVFAIVLVAILFLCNIPVYAAETDSNAEDKTIQAKENQIRSITLVDNTWTFVHNHQGATRSYPYSSIGFKVEITDSNGNPISDQIRIKLYNSTTGSAILTYYAYANGSLYSKNNISINSNVGYYFTYENLSSYTQAVRIHMVIYH